MLRVVWRLERQSLISVSLRQRPLAHISRPLQFSECFTHVTKDSWHPILQLTKLRPRKGRTASGVLLCAQLALGMLVHFILIQT